MLPSYTLLALGLASVSSAAVTKRLASDDILVLGVDGTTQVMKASDFAALEARAAAPAPIDLSSFPAEPAVDRRCAWTREVQVLSDRQFLNWDVAMSPVISSVGGKGSVTVTSGSEISNSISVGSSVSVGSLDQIFGMSLSIEASQSWSSSYEQSLTFEVPEGHHGLIVSQPYVRRVEGNVWSGCVDNLEKTPFMCDSYTDRTYGTDLKWVAGIIRLCSSTTYPIPYCIGEGSHE
ncbi:hypothetical protein B0T11DRAFT_356714 [Plectosphaerella cucumerina]|uniref:Uncharacterized protein n=1 Tax=Plectosphaerella cucumerina TaxID=40658 RepID=A0A8K0T7Z2_9PEZI|nr:hypothetical protein B0T11DRAFT_356714 [Plectosphaerella cucumerina]